MPPNTPQSDDEKKPADALPTVSVTTAAEAPGDNADAEPTIEKKKAIEERFTRHILDIRDDPNAEIVIPHEVSRWLGVRIIEEKLNLLKHREGKIRFENIDGMTDCLPSIFYFISNHFHIKEFIIDNINDSNHDFYNVKISLAYLVSTAKRFKITIKKVPEEFKKHLDQCTAIAQLIPQYGVLEVPFTDITNLEILAAIKWIYYHLPDNFRIRKIVFPKGTAIDDRTFDKVADKYEKMKLIKNQKGDIIAIEIERGGKTFKVEIGIGEIGASLQEDPEAKTEKEHRENSELANNNHKILTRLSTEFNINLKAYCRYNRNECEDVENRNQSKNELKKVAAKLATIEPILAKLKKKEKTFNQIGAMEIRIALSEKSKVLIIAAGKYGFSISCDQNNEETYTFIVEQIDRFISGYPFKGDTHKEENERSTAKSRNLPFLNSREAYKQGLIVKQGDDWVPKPGYEFVAPESSSLNWAVVKIEAPEPPISDKTLSHSATPPPATTAAAEPPNTAAETSDQLREENEIIEEMLKTAGVNLMIHMMVPDRQDWKGVYKENIWQSTRDEILPGDDWRVLHHNKLRRVNEDNSENFHNMLFSHERAPADYELKRMNLDGEHMVGWHADNEQIRIWKPKTDSSMDKFVNGGSSEEKVYCYTHLINAKAYKYYNRGSDVRIIAAIPESVAKKVYFAIKRNPEFRKRMVDRLLKDHFPALATYQPGIEYGEWEFNDNFNLRLGKDVEFDKKESKQLSEPQSTPAQRTITDTNGNIWTGDFDKTFTGRGKMEIKCGELTGATLEGIFTNGNYGDGLNILTYSDGRKEEIIWQNGKPIRGMIMKDDGTTNIGIFEELETPEGEKRTIMNGIKIYPDGRTVRMEGGVIMNDVHTETKTEKNTTVFSGLLYAQDETVYGPDHVISKSDRYIGYFDNNWSGKGARIIDGDVHIGEFINGKLVEGRKWLYKPEISKQVGTWNLTDEKFTGREWDRWGNEVEIENDIPVGRVIELPEPKESISTVQHAPIEPEPNRTGETIQYALNPEPEQEAVQYAPSITPGLGSPSESDESEDTETVEILNSARLMQKYANAYIEFARAMSKGKNIYKRPSLKEISDAIGVNVRALSGPDLQYCIGIDVMYNGKQWIMVLPNLNMIRSRKFSEGIFKGIPDTGKDGMPAKFCLVDPIHFEALIFDIKEDATKRTDKEAGKKSTMLEELEKKRKEREKRIESPEKTELKPKKPQEKRETLESGIGKIATLISGHRKKIIAAIGIATALYIFKDDIANVQISLPEEAEVTASNENEDTITFKNFQEALDKEYIYKDINGEYMPKIGYIFANDELPLDINNPSSYAVKRIK